MTHATLSVQLKSLEEYGLVKREQYEAIPPKVEYSLTDIGRKFHPVIAAMETFGNEYIAQMNAIVEAGTYAPTGMGKQSPIILVSIVSHASLTIVSRAGVPGSVYQSCFAKIR